MLRLLLPLLAPGEKPPTGGAQFSVTYEGLSWGWAFFTFVILVTAVAWSYHRFAPALTRLTRIGLITLRSILLGLLLLLLVRPILLISSQEMAQRPLLVMLDSSQSMGLVDHRETPDDKARAAIALGAIDPAGGLLQTVSNAPQDISRKDLLEALAANKKISLWPRLAAKGGVYFYGFGQKLNDLGLAAAPERGPLTTEASAAFFHGLHYDANLTAIGDGLRDLLDRQRDKPVSAILLITDGATNAGSSAIDAATIARQDGVPLFIYGIGVTSPKDIMAVQLDGPQTSNVRERLVVTAHLRVHGMAGRRGTVQLKADGKVVDEQPVEFHDDGEQEIALGYTPNTVGSVHLQACVPPLAEEVVTDNNCVETEVRIVDDKIKVLYVESEPTWDYQYLQQLLARDRRIKLQCVLLKGDPNLTTEPNSVFLDKIPDDKETLFANDLIIIGDVDPNDLGTARMKLISEWVDKMGGGLVFRAGPTFNPNAYRDSPLDSLLPVQPLDKTSDLYDEPVQLKLTTAGETSPLLMLATHAQENLAIWNGFPGVRWTAVVDKARPGAQVLLIDPTPARANRDGPEPVIAMQSYGLGQTLYIGTSETYRWRSHVGEKYYAKIWGQIIQALTNQHTGATNLVQLKTDRAGYRTGDHVKISGRIFQPGFRPAADPEIPGVVTIAPIATPGQPASPPQTIAVRLESMVDHPGDYQADFVAPTAGDYRFALVRDSSVMVKFPVIEPHVEMADIAMNEKLLRAMASASGGHFLREEELIDLPDLVTAKSSGMVTFKKIPLAMAPVLLVLMVLVGCAEWLWRRRLELK